MPHVLYYSSVLSSSDFSRYVRPMAVNSDMSVATDNGIFALADLRRRLANALAGELLLSEPRLRFFPLPMS
jgi:hypothetical protein